MGKNDVRSDNYVQGNWTWRNEVIADIYSELAIFCQQLFLDKNVASNSKNELIFIACHRQNWLSMIVSNKLHPI